MRFAFGFFAGILFSSGVVHAAGIENTRLTYTQKPIIHPGPLPGTSVIRSIIRKVDLTSEDGSKPGRIYGECFTLIGQFDVGRDFVNKPVQKDEILGFSCTTKLDD